MSVLGLVAPSTAARASAGASAEQHATRAALHAAAARLGAHGWATASTSMPELAASPRTSDTGALADPAHDNGPGYDAHGDVRALAVADTGAAIAVGLLTTTFDEPTTSHNWQGRALGDPAFTEGTGILWILDVNNDNLDDYDVFFVGNGTGITAVVTRDSDVNTALCAATPAWDAGHGYYAGFPASCIGRPAHVRAAAFMIYQTSTTLSEDPSGRTPVATPSPIVMHKTFDCTIRARGSNKLVTTETNHPGLRKGELRARSTTISSADEFKCVAIGKDKWAIRSRANSKYVTAEVTNPGSRKGVLRARAKTAGSRERYNFRPIDNCECYALRAVNGKFVSAEVKLAGSSRGLLRARAPSVGKWEKFIITPL